MSVAQPLTAAPPRDDPAAQTGPGRVAIVVLVTIGFAVVPLLLYSLWELWPTQAIIAAKAPTSVHWLGVSRNVSTEIRFFAIVAIAGALGGVMHSSRSLVWYVGRQGLKWHWVPFYVVTVVLGAGLAEVFYLLVRGGLFGGQATPTDVNPYGVAAIAALVGLFTEQALEMLKKVAAEVLSPPADAHASAAHAPPAASGDESDVSEQAGQVLTVTTGGVSYLGPTSATLDGDVSCNGEPPAYSFHYGPTTDYGLSTAEATADAAQSRVTAKVNGLRAGTEYHFRLVARTVDGSSVAGDDATFTTPAA
jgi:hypothetical protein